MNPKLSLAEFQCLFCITTPPRESLYITENLCIYIIELGILTYIHRPNHTYTVLTWKKNTATFRKTALYLKTMDCVSGKGWDFGICKELKIGLLAYSPQSGNSNYFSKIPYQFLTLALMCLLECFERYMGL